MPGIGGRHGVDVEAVAGTGEHLSMETLRRYIEPHRSRRIVKADPGVGFYLGETGRQGRRQHRRVAHRKAAGAAVGQGQYHHQRGRSRLGFQRGRGQGAAQAGHVHRQGLGAD